MPVIYSDCERFATKKCFGAIFLLVTAISCAHSDPTGPERENVVLITLDTTRRDALGAYGGPTWTTPTLDRIANAGIRFDQARTVAPITLPSHTSILSGQYPFEHGVRDNGTFRVNESTTLLPEVLQRHGYRTIAVTAAFVLDESFGLNQGFDEYSSVPRAAVEGMARHDERRAHQVVDEALSLLRTVPADQPYFLWCHFFDPHAPYEPRSDDRDLPAEAHANSATSRKQQRQLLYWREVAEMDRQIDRLLAGIGEIRRKQTHWTVVVADHGEGLGDHEEPTHAYLLYDSTIAIPFLLHHPSLPQGTVIDAPVSVIDLPSTLLSRLNLPPIETTGVDLTPTWESPENWNPDRTIYAETCAAFFTQGWSPLYAIVDGPRKVIVGPSVELFDGHNDPAENQNIAADHPQVVDQAHRQLAEMAQRTQSSSAHSLTSEEREALERLGYVVGDSTTQTEPVRPGWIPKGRKTPQAGLRTSRRYNRAVQRWNEGKIDEALQLLREVIQEEPENPYYLANGGAILLKQGLANEALDLLQRSVAISPAADPMYSLASCLRSLGRRAEAQAQLQATLEQFPEHLMSRLLLGEILVELRRPNDAIPHLEEFLRRFQGAGTVRAQAEQLLGVARADR